MTHCPQTERKDCPLCGKWLGWIDLQNPGRLPTAGEWRKAKTELQSTHEKNFVVSLNRLTLKEKQA
jgi:hypothetical protein